MQIVYLNLSNTSIYTLYIYNNIAGYDWLLAEKEIKRQGMTAINRFHTLFTKIVTMTSRVRIRFDCVDRL